MRYRSEPHSTSLSLAAPAPLTACRGRYHHPADRGACRGLCRAAPSSPWCGPGSPSAAPTAAGGATQSRTSGSPAGDTGTGAPAPLSPSPGWEAGSTLQLARKHRSRLCSSLELGSSPLPRGGVAALCIWGVCHAFPRPQRKWTPLSARTCGGRTPGNVRRGSRQETSEKQGLRPWILRSANACLMGSGPPSLCRDLWQHGLLSPIKAVQSGSWQLPGPQLVYRPRVGLQRPVPFLSQATACFSSSPTRE